MQLLDEIQAQIKDEQTGSKKYNELAELAEKEDFPFIAAVLYSMAADEDKHETLLEEIIAELEGDDEPNEDDSGPVEEDE